jgi:hypothetical protein
MGENVIYNYVGKIYKFAIKLTNPLMVLLFIQNKYFPDYLWARYLKQCGSIKKTVFLLSFDCDTELDIEVLPEVVAKLQEIGIKPVLAVPGELIEKGQDVYKQFAASGIEFINHGYVQHTHLQLPERIYRSNFFYHKLSREQISQDINKGHEAICKYLEITPTGFRTPHFGSFQKSSELQFLWKLLENMGYEFSSSTTPRGGIKKGPLWKERILELPVTGCPSWPTKVLDSWGFGFAPMRSVEKADYISQIEKLLKDVEAGRNIVINIYADPSQVYDWPEFFAALEKLAPYNVGSFKDLIDIVSL